VIILGVSISVLAVLIVGIAVARKIDGDSANYLVAGRQLGVPLVAVSLTAAAVDSNAIVGNTDLTSQAGFWAGASLAIGLAVCLLLSGIFLAKPMNRMKLFTLGDFFRQRYGKVPEKIASVLMIFAFTILLAGNMVACGFLLERFAGIPYAFGVIVAVLLVLAYTVGGGLFSDAYTAVIQTAITVVATVAMLIWVAVSFGIVIPEGMGPFDFEQLTSPDAGAPINWATLISLGIGDLVAIDFMQRIFGARSPEVARRSCFIGAGLTFSVGVVYALIALTATAVLGLTTENGPILYQLLGDYAPPMLAILVLSGVVAASFSTASGAILATSAIAVRNLFGIRRMVITGRRDPLLRWTRLAMIPICLVGVIIAIRVSQTGILLTLAFDLMLACLAGPFILGLFWRAGGAAAMLAGVAVGFTLRTTLLVLTPTMYGVPNDLLYIPNALDTEWLDGWSTLIAATVAIATYVIIALVRPRRQIELEREQAVVADLRDEEAQSEPVPAPVL
jgi:solute:Na+ symporter, SSS family